jgi:hypothetical protein
MWPASSPGRRVVQDHLLGELRSPRQRPTDRPRPDDVEVTEEEPPG